MALPEPTGTGVSDHMRSLGEPRHVWLFRSRPVPNEAVAAALQGRIWRPLETYYAMGGRELGAVATLVSWGTEVSIRL